MGRIVPDAIERYLASLNRGHDAVLDEIARDGVARGLPLVDAEVGALLAVLVAATGASRVLEIGTAIGYSGIWLARGLPAGGMLLTMEQRPERAAEAKDNFARAGLADRASVIVGRREAEAGQGRRTVRSHFSGRRQAALHAAAGSPRRAAASGRTARDGQRAVGRRGRAGYAASPRHDVEDTRAIAEYNERLAAHPHHAIV